jgi:hypothetical protein
MKITSSAAGRIMPLCYRASKIFNSTFFLILLLIASALGCKKIVEEQGLVDICPTCCNNRPG